MNNIANEGKRFEEDVETSSNEQGVFYLRIKDVNVANNLRGSVKNSPNKYDALVYKKEHLFALEMKSTKATNLSFSEAIVKQHQLDNLEKASKYDGVIAGLLINFREPTNRTFFIHINDYLIYKNIAENGLESPYENRVNKSSISIGICEEIGTEVKSVKKKVRYRYYINDLCDRLIEKYSNRTSREIHKQ